MIIIRSKELVTKPFRYHFKDEPIITILNRLNIEFTEFTVNASLNKLSHKNVCGKSNVKLCNNHADS
jgi:hypothetical protein